LECHDSLYIPLFIFTTLFYRLINLINRVVRRLNEPGQIGWFFHRGVPIVPVVDYSKYHTSEVMMSFMVCNCPKEVIGLPFSMISFCFVSSMMMRQRMFFEKGIDRSVLIIYNPFQKRIFNKQFMV